MIFSVIDRTDNVFRVRFDKDHPIYKAHFPQNPITPGVVLLETLELLLEQSLERDLRLKRVKNIKFISVLNPELTTEVDFKLDNVVSEVGVEVQCVISSSDGVIAKISTIYE